MLTKLRGPTCYDDIKTVDGVVRDTFKSACEAMRLLDGDKEYICGFVEAAQWSSGNALRHLFVSILLSNCLVNVGTIWDKCKKVLSEDMFYTSLQQYCLSGMI